MLLQVVAPSQFRLSLAGDGEYMFDSATWALQVAATQASSLDTLDCYPQRHRSWSCIVNTLPLQCVKIRLLMMRFAA